MNFGIRRGCPSLKEVKIATQFGLAEFDRVFFSYSLSMIPRWQLR